MMELNEISAKDEFVDSWSDNTKDRVASAYLTILRKVGMLDRESHLNALGCSNFSYYWPKVHPGFLKPVCCNPTK